MPLARSVWTFLIPDNIYDLSVFQFMFPFYLHLPVTIVMQWSSEGQAGVGKGGRGVQPCHCPMEYLIFHRCGSISVSYTANKLTLPFFRSERSWVNS